MDFLYQKYFLYLVIESSLRKTINLDQPKT